MSLIKDLQNIGLSEKEARVYLAALELGQASVQQIAIKSGVIRATAYIILDSLLKKGMVSSFEQGKKTFFVASSPESLLANFAIKKKEIDEKEKFFNTLLPDLKLIYNRQEDKPVIKFFEGKQGSLQCIQEFFSNIDTGKDDLVRMAYNKDLLEKTFTAQESQEFREVRKKYKIKSRALYNYAGGEVANTFDGIRKKIDFAKHPITADVSIAGDLIRITSLNKNLPSVLIKDKDISNTLKTIFDLAFENLDNK
jgi:sugar-specific transcriptional regulator TrmB